MKNWLGEWVLAILLILALITLTGCATTVTTSRTVEGACQSKVSGLMIAHIVSLPDACRLGD